MLSHLSLDLSHFTSYSFTISGICSFSSICCSLLSSVSLQCLQQRIRSSSFSSKTELTLLILLMLPRREPWMLLGEQLGLVWEAKTSLLAVVSLPERRPTKYNWHDVIVLMTEHLSWTQLQILSSAHLNLHVKTGAAMKL